MPVGESRLLRYEGLNDQAAALWRQWLALYEDQFASFAYNVRVGQGLNPGPSATDQMREYWRLVTTKRIDVVAQRAGQTWVIEIEPRPGLRTFGQVQGYMHLLPKFQPVAEQLIGAVVCATMGHDMASIFKTHNIPYFVFRAGRPPTLPPTFPPSLPTAA